MYSTFNVRLNQLLSKLHGVRETGLNQWEALCPAHNDKRPSLSVSLGNEGKVVCQCHGKCDTEDVLAAVDMTMKDLFPSKPSDVGEREIVAEYDFQDRNGELVYQVVRTEPKGFFQRMPDGQGGWINSVKGCEQVPYRLPELLQTESNTTVFVVEGEKDVDRLRSMGLAATCNAGGAGKWRREYAEYFDGRRVVIIPDNDAPGLKHATKVAEALKGIANVLKIVQLPNVGEGGDVSDWIDGGGTELELIKLAETAVEWDRTKDAAPLPGLVCMADVEPETVQWLWPGRIPLAKLTLLSGDPGLGKSFVTLDIAARVSSGAAWPDGATERQSAGGVVLLSAEDGLADTIRPRLDAHDANCKRIHCLTSLEDLKKDIEQLRDAIDRTVDCRLIVVDPISAYLGKTDSNSNAEVRALLTPLADLAADKQVAILAVTHLRKGEGPAIQRSIGSIGFTAAVRAAWAICRDPSDPERRLMLSLKNNLAADSANGLAYKIESVDQGKIGVVRWETDAVTITADEAFSLPPKQLRMAKPVLDANEQLAVWIATHHDGRATARQVQRGDRGFLKVNDAERAMQKLAELGYGRWENVPPSAGGGRPTRVLVLGSRSTSTEPSETTAA